MGIDYDQCACGCKRSYYDDHEMWTRCDSEEFLQGKDEYDEVEYSGCGARYMCTDGGVKLEADGEVYCQQCTDDPERIIPTDTRILEYILEKLGKTRDQLVEDLKKSLTPSPPPSKRPNVEEPR